MYENHTFSCMVIIHFARKGCALCYWQAGCPHSRRLPWQEMVVAMAWAAQPSLPEKSGRSENVVSFLTYFRFPSSHTTVRAVRHTAVSCLSCPFWTPHIGHRHFFSIVGIRPIVLKREFLFGHLTTTVSKYTDCLVRQCTIRPFALTVTRSATSASADSSTFVVTILADCRGLAG